MKYSELKEMALANPVTVNGAFVVNLSDAPAIEVNSVRFRRRWQPVRISNSVVVNRPLKFFARVRLAWTVFIHAGKSA